MDTLQIIAAFVTIVMALGMVCKSAWKYWRTTPEAKHWTRGRPFDFGTRQGAKRSRSNALRARLCNEAWCQKNRPEQSNVL